MNHENRIILQVVMEEAAKAEEIFLMLMGDEVPACKASMQVNAGSVKHLAI